MPSMIYQLTEEQYDLLSDKLKYYSHEYHRWQKTIKELYNLDYIDFDYEPEDKRPPNYTGHWGSVEGKEKYITMFLLNL